MDILVIKTSSLGDVVHLLPALTDASQALPGSRFDWLVEEAFAAVPGWHPAVDRVIPVALRRWRRHPVRAVASSEWRQFRRKLSERRYAAVVDAQGLIKSALLSRLAHGPRHGLDRDSAREPLAALSYQRRHAVARNQHAVARLRQLFAASLDYPLPATDPDFGLSRNRAPRPPQAAPYLVFLHATTWTSKHWPERYWNELARLAGRRGFGVRLPWHSAGEQARARRIAAAGDHVEILPQVDLTGLATVLAGAAGVVGVDTGLAHLAAALGVPGVTLYGPTTPALTGVVGPRQSNLAVSFPCAPCRRRDCRYLGPAAVRPACFGRLDPLQVMAALSAQLQESGATAPRTPAKQSG